MDAKYKKYIHDVLTFMQWETAVQTVHNANYGYIIMTVPVTNIEPTNVHITTNLNSEQIEYVLHKSLLATQNKEEIK
ncbi:MAG: hypothetical protein ACC657_05540 [Thiohalomonadales bacterium]